MRPLKSKILLVFILALMMGTLLSAQPSGKNSNGIPGLSEDQKAQIHKLRISHLKDIQPINNQIGENRAHFKSLMNSESPDMTAINKNIDEFGSLRSQLLKKQAAHIQDIRKLLTEEQRLIFDQRRAEKANNLHQRRGFMGKSRLHGNTGWAIERKKKTEANAGQQ